ncbi:hypothetical protein LIA77_05541 [Sarocladium implicatum]|nr:hypothetical protein LIA77_05541 [Sarocladium implicatum]
MDGGGRRGRYYEPQVHASSSGKYAASSTPQTSRVPSSAENDRIRASALTPVSSTPRGSSGSGSYSTYYSEPVAAFSATGMPSTSLNYGTDYSSDARQQPASFSNYSSGPVMYNVAQPGAAQSQVYDGPAFASRSSASGIQIMTPDVASTYFGTGTPSSASQTSVPQPNVYQQASGIGFATSMPGMATMQHAPAGADVSMAEESEYVDNALEERWINYKRQMASVFQDIANGALQSAADTLSTVSTWLLSQVSDLGLTLDDASLHADRVQLWKNFNHAWLALGRAQKEGMQSSQHSDALLSRDTIQKMVDDLIHLCNGLERHGLLDYGIGVWEERIVDVFADCMQLFAENEDEASSSR